ncbi:MAG: TIGR04076 family protein [Promethearchaeota archaeon]
MTVLRVFKSEEVFDKSPIKRSSKLPPCEIHQEGQEFMVNLDMKMPQGFCHWAWLTINCAVRMLLFGGDYPWTEEKGKAVVCCADGLRPVVYLLERI